jgi:hypothetical protein
MNRGVAFSIVPACVMAFLLGGCVSSSVQEESQTYWEAVGDPVVTVEAMPVAPNTQALFYRFWVTQEEHEFASVKTVKTTKKERLGVGNFGDYLLGDLLMGRLISCPFSLVKGLLGDGDSLLKFPFVDLGARFFGHGHRRYMTKRNAPGAGPQAFVDNYALNVLDGLGWFLPGYPLMNSEAKLMAQSVETISTSQVRSTGNRRTQMNQVPSPEEIQKLFCVYIQNKEEDLIAAAGPGMARANLAPALRGRARDEVLQIDVVNRRDGSVVNSRAVGVAEIVPDAQSARSNLLAAPAAPSIPTPPKPSLPQSQFQAAPRPAPGPEPEEWSKPYKIQRKQVAIVIGINQYESSELPSLDNAVNDARAIARVIEENYKFDRIYELYDGDATREGIITTIRDCVSALREGDNLLIYYAGHGWMDEVLKEGYWIPSDARNQSHYISNADIIRYIEAMEKAQHILIAADSCFAGKFLTRSMRGLDVRDTGVDVEESAVSRYFHKMDNRKSRTVLTSGANEPVPDGGREGHSVFAYYFLRALTNPDKTVFTDEDLAHRVREAVAINSRQTPLVGHLRGAGHEGGQMVLVKRR